MKALRISQFGGLEKLELCELPKPHPAPDEVLVRVMAAGLNSSDVSNALGKHPYTTLPRIPGRDFAGVVVEGPDALRGAQVWGTGKEFGFTRDGSHAEFMLVPVAAVARKPASLSFVEAAACGVPYTTAWSAIERCEVVEGTQLLVIGAAGAVGSAALSLARWRGARAVAAVRQPAQAEKIRERGFEAIVLPADGKLATEVKTVFPSGAQVILDTTGAWAAQSIPSLGDYGRLAVIVTKGEGEVNLPLRDLYRRGSSIVGVNSLLYSGADCAKLLERLRPFFEAGNLAPPQPILDRRLSAEVYKELQSGKRGKIVFTFSQE